MRKRLPETRKGITKKASVANMEYYVTVNFYHVKTIKKVTK